MFITELNYVKIDFPQFTILILLPEKVKYMI